MKTVTYSPLALARLEEIYRFSLENWGEARADTYYDGLIARIEALAAGELPRARSCVVLFRDEPDEEEMAGLSYYHEGSHYLILRERANELEVAGIILQGRDLERHIRDLSNRYRSRERDDDRGLER